MGEISEILFPLAEEVYLTRPHLARAATPEEILAAARFRPKRLVIEPEPSLAVARACQASSQEDAVMIIGSLFLVGAVKKALLEGQLQLATDISPGTAEGLA
jgi:dihydrofolate synthase/folylpolyglutamate synthase